VLEKEQQALAAAEKRAHVANIVRKSLYGLAVLMALFALWKIIRSFRTEIQPLEEDEIPFGNEDIAQEIPTETQRKIQIQQKVATLSTENPQEAAKLLKAWIVEEVEENAET
jgi:flagellar biosynthesis/type III secretory pathway M-ring protein FliF/YscJ